jgi:hypothetical protein
MSKPMTVTHWRYFFLGFILALSLVLVLGAYRENPGRYQLGAWGASGVGFGAFVTDTYSGKTKIVYLNTGTEHEKNLGKPFTEIQAAAPFKMNQ